MISWAVGEKRGVSTSARPSVRNRLLAPSWSMIASRLTRLSAGPDSDDVDDAGVEIAFFAGDPLIDLVGDDVSDAAPVLLGCRIAVPGQLLLGKDVPQAELDPEPSVALRLDRAGHQRLRIDLAPIGKPRLGIGDRDVLDEAARIERPKQARALEIGRDDAGDIASRLALIRRHRPERPGSRSASARSCRS